MNFGLFTLAVTTRVSTWRFPGRQEKGVSEGSTGVLGVSVRVFCWVSHTWRLMGYVRLGTLASPIVVGHWLSRYPLRYPADEPGAQDSWA